MTDVDRTTLVRRGLRLNYITIAYNSLEALASLIAGVITGSIALVGFGVDSIIEVAASGAAQWRLRSDVHAARRDEVEYVSRLMVAWSFVLLAAYIAYESTKSLWRREPPDRSIAGVVILALSVVVMPALAGAKRRVARALQSATLASEATQTSLCAYLSAIALVGVVLNAALGWWWADPVAAIAMVPIIAKEGFEGTRRRAFG